MTAHPSARLVGRLRRSLLAWYDIEHRDFPWRATRDPYAVLVSEVMLQQTQAARVVDRFPRFMARFPSVSALASASSAEVLAAWSGLGYNRRALALQRAAATVAERGWPRDVNGLVSLAGVGPYTARAVASLAFDAPVGVVDTNVRRWLLRRIGGPDRPAALQATADALAAPGRGADVAAWTHATMEFGASICRARNPRCDVCPVAIGCPSRGGAVRIAVPRQASLRGSSRAYRGAVLRALAAADGHALPATRLRRELAAQAQRIGPRLRAAEWSAVLGGLERDGLIHQREGTVRLGTATIEA